MIILPLSEHKSTTGVPVEKLPKTWRGSSLQAALQAWFQTSAEDKAQDRPTSPVCSATARRLCPWLRLQAHALCPCISRHLSRGRISNTKLHSVMYGRFSQFLIEAKVATRGTKTTLTTLQAGLFLTLIRATQQYSIRHEC